MTQQNWNSGAASEEDVQMPLGVGSDNAGEYLPSGNGKPKVGGSTLALVGAFGIALAIIYGLGMQTKPREASAETVARQQLMQSAISELLEKNDKGKQIQDLLHGGDTDKLVAMFYSYMRDDPTARAPLPHDPFANEEERAVTIAPSTPQTQAVAVVSSNPAEAEKLRKVAETFNSLKLQSVIVGRRPAAMINNNMVTVGNRIGDFIVADIKRDRVVLTYNDNKFELPLDRVANAAQPQ